MTPSVHSTVWRKDKTGLQYRGSQWSTHRVQCPHSQFDRGDFSLQIDNVKKEDGGLYFCRVELEGKVTENTVMLRIIEGKKHTRSLGWWILYCATATP